MSTLHTLFYTVLTLVPIAAAPRAIHCLIKIVTDGDQTNLYKQRLKNLGIYVIIAIIGLDLLMLILSVYLT